MKHICTIATDGIWLDMHLPRWVRYIRKNVPDAQLYLFYAGDDVPKSAIMGEFVTVRHYRMEVVNREWLNSVRMGATKEFGVPEILYLDCDCDVLADLAPVFETKTDIALAACESPTMHTEWGDVCQRLQWGPPQKEWNNGLVLMRDDFSACYKAAWDKVAATGVDRMRIHGTLAFNVMLRTMGDKHATVPYEYGVIWHDVDALATAKIVQYCNDRGQDKRVKLEMLWNAARI